MKSADVGIGNLALDLKAIRDEFPILKRQINGSPLVYLDNAASSQKPNTVLDAMTWYYQHAHANVHRGVHSLSQEATHLFESARKRLARFLGTPDDTEIIFTRGTTESINLAAYTFGLSQLQEGDEIILSGMEHHSNIVPWQMVCGMRGASIKVIPVDDHGNLNLDWLDSHINHKTKLVSVVHVSNSLGTINDIQRIITTAHQHDVPVLIDGAQSAAHMEINVSALDADFFVLSGHKMYGPTGSGVFYAKRSWLDRLPPFHGGGEMIREVKWSGTTYNDPPFKFEAGTPDIAGAIGLAAACDYLDSFDRKALAQHEQELLQMCTEAMETLPGLQTIGRARNKASVFSFIVEGLHPYDLGTLLDQQGIAVRTGHHCTQPLMDQYGIPGTVRASFAFYNTTEEVERLVNATRRAIQILS